MDPKTALIRAPEAREASRGDEQRLSAILEGIGDGFWALDREWRLTYFNRAAELFFGQSRADVLGRSIWEVYPTLVGSEFERRYRRAMAERTAEEFEVPSGARPGCWLEVRAFPTPEGLGVSFRDVTSRRRAEQALIEREAHLAAIFGQATAGFAEVDLEGRFVRVNDRYCELVGRSRAELLGGTRMQDITHPEDLNTNVLLFHRAIETGEPYELEKRYIRPDGTLVWVNNSVTCIRNTVGQPQSVLAVSVDVGERKQAEDALRRSEEKLRMALLAARLGAWERDLRTGELTATASCKANLGLPPDAPLTFEMLQAMRHPDDVEWVTQAIRHAIEERVDYDVEYRVVWPDGSVHWILARGHAISDENGRPIRMVGVTLDITERKAIEEALRESELRKSAMLEAALDCIVTITKESRVVEWNPAAERTFGYARDAALGRDLAELIIPPELRERHRQGVARYLATGDHLVLGRRLELEALRADGSRFPVEVAVEAIRIGDEPHFTAYLRDLTVAKRDEAELQRQREALYQAEKMTALGSLLAGVAHELNNPLSIVVGHALLLEESAADPAAAERAVKIRAAAERCSRIVKIFLAMARQRPAERRRFHINDVVAGAVDLVAYGLRSDGIEVGLDLAASLPALEGDADQIGQVLANLLVNAEQALQEVPQPRRLAVRTAYDEATDMVCLSVADNGKGVPEAVRSRIFDPFFTTKPVGAGTGLGLSLCHGIVVSHGGTVSVEDTPGGGATFVIALPAAKMDETGRAPVAAVFTSSVPRRALIVDDEPEIAKLLAEVLAQQRVDSDIVLNGMAAVERLRDGDYDVILSDLRMPDLDGAGLFEWIRAERAGLLERVVFVTGDRLGPAATAFLQRCGRPYLEKPFLPEEVWRTVGTVLDRTVTP